MIKKNKDDFFISHIHTKKTWTKPNKVRKKIKDWMKIIKAGNSECEHTYLGKKEVDFATRW